jgi:hypothetical protein
VFPTYGLNSSSGSSPSSSRPLAHHIRIPLDGNASSISKRINETHLHKNQGLVDHLYSSSLHSAGPDTLELFSDESDDDDNSNGEMGLSNSSPDTRLTWSNI